MEDLEKRMYVTGSGDIKTVHHWDNQYKTTCILHLLHQEFELRTIAHIGIQPQALLCQSEHFHWVAYIKVKLSTDE